MIMKANELRIGNLINCIIYDEDDNGDEKKIEAVGKFIGFDPFESFWWVECDLVREYYDEFAPIPLTEEWLVRFGFKKIITAGSIFQFSEFHVQNFSPLGFFECRNHIKIEHVHQLQNLYFALTGEELELKP
jgi:hypothetical protein